MQTLKDVLGWKQYMNRWESRTRQWNRPTDFVNPADAILNTNEVGMLSRYFYLLYYALINLGLGEIAPVNEIEFIFVTLSCIVSAIFFSIVFG